ncbi:MAG: hypothetical protein KDN18_06225 [Verrucomicrobiae bacterium]|nr:hypothetical protein [Verrucomicrobiae bacterium]
MNPESAPLLEVENLTVELPDVLEEGRIGLRHVGLTLKRNEIFVLAGESGSGPLLLASLLAGIAAPRLRLLSGRLVVLGQEVIQSRAGRRRLCDLRRGPVTVIGDASIVPLEPVHTVRQWLREVRRLATRGSRAWEDCFFHAGLVEPETILGRRLASLTPLTRARLGVVRSMLLGSELIISLEVEKGLDPLSRIAYRELLRRIRDEGGPSILCTVGSLRGVERYANRVAVFYEGGLLESGPPRELLAEPRFAYTREFHACAPFLEPGRGDVSLGRSISREAVREAEEAVHQGWESAVVGPTG